MNHPSWISILAGAALLSACDERQERDVDQARKDLEATKRDAQKDLADAQAKAKEDVARAEEKLAETKREATKEQYTYVDRVRYRDLVKRDLAEAEKELNELELEAKKATGDAKKRIDKSIADLKVERDELRVKLDRADEVTEKEWIEFRDGVNRGVDKLRKDVREAIDSLKKKT